jgi:hypothetical protein
MGFLLVGAFLDGTRYLYLAALGWGWVVGGMVDAVSEDRRARRTAWGLIALLGIAVIVQQQRTLSDWREAARERDFILIEAARFATATGCERVAGVTGLPRTFRGAQLFNNGFEEAFAQGQTSAALARVCEWTWTGTTFRQR